jgi:hypothetical protein
MVVMMQFGGRINVEDGITISFCVWDVASMTYGLSLCKLVWSMPTFVMNSIMLAKWAKVRAVVV